MSSLSKKIVIALSVVVFAYVTAGYVLGRSSDDKAFRALSVYSDVLGHIQRDYVDEPNIRQVTSGALHGLLDSLDPQSSYMSQLEYADYKERSAAPAKAGAGLALTKRFGYISVISALPDSPAQKAGLRLGDVVEKIAGFTTGQMGVDQAQLLLSGEPGTVVKLSVIRRGKAEPQEIELTLAKLAAPKLVEDKLEGDVAYLRVPALEAGAAKQIRDELAQLERQGAHKLILDLRNCALGEDREGIATAQLFVSSGTITSLKGQSVTPVVSSADPSKVAWTQPVTVLIGNGTSGAAEIVAGAIADNHRGETVGDRTYGTASEQKLIQLEDGSALILTVADYYTPAGKEIPIDGVAPTREVRPGPDDRALLDEYPPAPSSSPDDPVVKKALEILQGAGAAAARKAA
jgi:carboxyl-terminal processing protease